VTSTQTWKAWALAARYPDGEEMIAAVVEEVVDPIVGGEEVLHVLGRLEPPHLPLSLSRRLIGVLRPVVQIFVLPVLDAGRSPQSFISRAGGRPAEG